jgi:adenine-specific DNA methylase
MRLLEIRGELPDEVVCPDTGQRIKTGKAGGTVPKRSNFTCGACGTVQDVLTTIKASEKSGPVAAYAVQGYCPICDKEKRPYRGRFFSPITDATAINAAFREWERRRETDLKAFWPRSELPYGFMTHMNNGGIPNHGFTHWWTMFNPRQLLVHTQLLRAITTGAGQHRTEVRDYVLGSFQQHLRNQSMFSFWHIKLDKLAPALSNSNFHPKSTMIEVGVFPPMGYGPWASTVKPLLSSADWKERPWELVSTDWLAQTVPALAKDFSGKSEKTRLPDTPTSSVTLECTSATELSSLGDQTFDLVITDPPFGGLLHYAELADFFYVWLRLVLKERYPEKFSPEYTPKTLEAVASRARHPEDPDAFYQRLLTGCWREAHRILKPGGMLAFTFHHSEDEPWVAVLESLFDAEFYLEATYPIRSDETKGEGAKPGTFGSQKIEYDIVHVCRKRREEPKPVSWAKMRRQVLDDVRQLQNLLEHHQKSGLLEADLQVIRRGKALEYYSRHYGKVYVDEGKAISVKDALLGII